MKQENGFTLVELAIALMVIGLLIGGVLKGQELIENARITATIRQIKAYDTAAMIFRNTYNALPGDIKRPNRIPNCTEAICNIGGNGNGRVSDDPGSAEETEIYNFFPHLTKAGMIQGPTGGDADDMAAARDNMFYGEAGELFSPSLPFETVYMFIPVYGTFQIGKNMHYYRIFTLPMKTALALDMKMDDGDGNAGMITVDDGSDCAYDVSDQGDGLDYPCGIRVQAGF